jgi:hypothetical protein
MLVKAALIFSVAVFRSDDSAESSRINKSADREIRSCWRMRSSRTELQKSWHTIRSHFECFSGSYSSGASTVPGCPQILQL